MLPVAANFRLLALARLLNGSGEVRLGKSDAHPRFDPGAPVHDGPLDGAGLRPHHGARAGVVRDASANRLVQCAPARSFSVQQSFPTDHPKPLIQRPIGNASLLEIMKNMIDTARVKPRAGFFDSVAMGNAIQANNGFAHRTDHAGKRGARQFGSIIPPAMKNLSDWLAHCERLHPATIELGLERVRAVAQRMELAFACPVITVAGTNGKGSTCAMLDSVLTHAGYRTGLYTSPHLVRFAERCLIQGQVVDDEDLMPFFERVEAVRGEVALTYFEFTTLAILARLAAAALDVVILEVGLGGRLDAVNVVDPDCAVITSIDLDHMEFLGPDREAIGYEKAGIMRTGRPVVVSDPAPPRSVMDRAREIGAELWCAGRDFHVSGDRQQWSWQGRGRRYSGLAFPALRGANQLVNAAGVIAALQALRDRLPVNAQALRNGLVLVEWPGRFQIIPGEPALVLDVAHNPHAVATLAENLDAMGFYPATHAVFGAMADKDVAGMLARVDPLVDRWYFCDLPTPRAASATDLMSAWRGVSRHAGAHGSVAGKPSEALQAALAAADPADRIIVFGSFFTVGGVLQDGLPRRSARHLGA